MTVSENGPKGPGRLTKGYNVSLTRKTIHLDQSREETNCDDGLSDLIFSLRTILEGDEDRSELYSVTPTYH